MSDFASTFLEPGPLSCTIQVLLFTTVFTSSILYISSSSIQMRLTSVVILASIIYSYQQNLSIWTTNLGLRSIIVDTAWILFFHATELLLVSRVSRNDLIAPTDLGKGNGDREPSPQNRKNLWSDAGLVFSVVSLLWKWRRIGTKWEIKEIPFRPHQTRLQSSLRSFLTFICAYLIMDLLTARSAPNIQLMAPGKEALFHRFSELKTEELVFRFVETPLYLLSTMIAVVMFYNLICCGMVLSGISTPEECAPLFGSIGEACSVRGYWGTFYHQGLRKAVSGPADHLMDTIFYIPRGTVLSRYSRLLLAFIISGGIHHMGESSMGVPAAERGQFIFFVAQAFAIMAEDVVIGVYERLPTGLKLHRFLEYALGYAWVFIGPYWFFPTARCINYAWDETVPFSVVRWAFKVLAS